MFDIFVKALDTALQMVDLTKKDIIIQGDFNIDLLDKSNADTKSVNRFISEYGLVKLINGPNRFGSMINSCID